MEWASPARPVWVQGWKTGQSLVCLEQEPRFLGFSLHSLQETIPSFLLILLQATPVLQFGFRPPAGKSRFNFSGTKSTPKDTKHSPRTKPEAADPVRLTHGTDGSSSYS